MEYYVICKELSTSGLKTVELRQKRSDGIKNASKLLRTIFNEESGDRKIASIGQTIIQTARPRVLIAPLQISLAIQMHHHYGSNFLIDSLNCHGFCSSYTKVKKFKKSTAQTKGTDIPDLTPGHFVQYVADNVDHNVCTRWTDRTLFVVWG